MRAMAPGGSWNWARRKAREVGAGGLRRILLAVAIALGFFGPRRRILGTTGLVRRDPAADFGRGLAAKPHLQTTLVSRARMLPPRGRERLLRSRWGSAMKYITRVGLRTLELASPRSLKKYLSLVFLLECCVQPKETQLGSGVPTGWGEYCEIDASKVDCPGELTCTLDYSAGTVCTLPCNVTSDCPWEYTAHCGQLRNCYRGVCGTHLCL